MSARKQETDRLQWLVEIIAQVQLMQIQRQDTGHQWLIEVKTQEQQLQGFRQYAGNERVIEICWMWVEHPQPAAD